MGASMSYLAVFLIIAIANLALGYAAFFALRHAFRASGGFAAARRRFPLLGAWARE
jgi:hypothetical protein